MKVRVDHAADWRALAVAPDAVVLEEDTALILTAPSAAKPDSEPAVRVMTDLYFDAVRQPGEVVVRNTVPPELLAVVVDLDAEPISSMTAVRAAIERALAVCRARGFRHIAMEPLGCRTGQLHEQQFQGLLTDVLSAPGLTAGLESITLLDRAAAPYARPAARD